MKMETNNFAVSLTSKWVENISFQKENQSIMMWIVESVCLGAEKAKAYCRKLPEKRIFLREPKAEDPTCYTKDLACYKVMIWGCITWHGVGPIYDVDVNINADNIKKILGDNLHPDLPHHFSNWKFFNTTKIRYVMCVPPRIIYRIEHDYSQHIVNLA